MIKRLTLLTAVVCACSTGALAQYSNATLNGPWLFYAPPLDAINDEPIYMVFDGAGGVVDIGGFCESVGGTYAVASNGAITGVLDCGGPYPLNGQFHSPDSATIDISGSLYALVRMLDAGSMEGTLTGVLATQNCGSQGNVTIDVDAAGVVTGAAGLIAPVTGRVYSDRGIFQGHLRTGGTNGWQELSIQGYVNGATLTGVLLLDNQSCGIAYADLIFSSATEVADGIRPTLGLTIFPNPASTAIQLQFERGVRGTTMVNIFDSVGELVRSVTLQREEQFIDISTLSNGSYLVQVIAADRTGTQRLVVQR